MPHVPLISIVTPCRNAAAFLPRALESVVRGAGEVAPGDVEHIIIDGGSTDGSVTLIRRHAEANPRLVVHWSSQPDAGQSDAINRGMALATGRYATWLNGDDWFEPGGLGAMAGRLREEPPDVVVGRSRFVDESGRVVWEPRPPEELSLTHLLSLRSRWFNGESLVQPEVFFSRELFLRVGGLKVSNHYAMDHELWCRMVIAGARFARIDALIASAGAHAGQKTQDNREVVRALLSYALPMAKKYSEMLGDQAGQVLGELQGMAEKLRVADAAIRWWRCSLDMPDSKRRPLAYEAQPSPPAQGDRVRMRAVAAAARALRWRRRLRVGFFECDAHVVAQVVRALGARKTLELHAAAGSRLAISQAAAAVRSLISDGSSIVGHQGSLVAGPFELVVVQTLSARAAAPVSTLGGLWSRLAPRGVLLQLDDPLLGTDVQRYIACLAKQLGDNLSKNDDVVLSEDADGWLVALADRSETPAIGGLVLREIVPRLSPDASCRYERAFADAGDHPLTPFAPVGPREVSGFASWSSSVWRKS